MADTQYRGRGRGRRGSCSGSIKQQSYGRQNGQQQYSSDYNGKLNYNGGVSCDGGSGRGKSYDSSNNNARQHLSNGHNYQGRGNENYHHNTGRGTGRGRGGDSGRGHSQQGGRGGGGGRGRGNGGSQGDVPISIKKATEIRNKALLDVFQARPKQFPQYPEGQGTRLTLRPSYVNQHKQIWKRVSLYLNLFLIESKQQTAYQYDLQVHKSKAQDAPTASKQVYQQVFRFLQKYEEWPERSTVHDGRSTVWAETGDLREMDKFPVKLQEYKQPFYVTFVFAEKIENLGDLQTEALKENVRDVGFIVPAPCLRLLDSALRHPAIHSEFEGKYALRGRSIFKLNQQGKPLDNQGVYEVLMGYRESVRVVSEGLVLNLNTIYNMSRKALPLLQFLYNNNVTKFDRLIGGDIKRLNYCLKGVKVKYEIPLRNGEMQKREKRIKCISDKCASDEYIRDKNMNVMQYFWHEYGYKIKYPYLNLLDVSTNDKFKILVPMECCRILEGQFERAEGKLQADLIRAAAKLPSKRYEDIETALQDVESRIEDSPADFWLNLAKRQWLRGVGYAIEAPIVQYGRDICVQPKDGAWSGFCQKQGRNEFFYYGVPAKIDSWAIINMWRNEEDVRRFGKNIVDFGKQVGMQIAELPPDLILPCQFARYSSIKEQYQVLGRVLQQTVERCNKHFGQKPKIVFVALDGMSNQYSTIKGMLEGNKISSPIKIPSQCAQINKYNEKNHNESYICNLMKKVNMKAGGLNHRLLGGEASVPGGPFAPNQQQTSQFFPIMIMGADVTHPKVAKGQKDQGTSIAAVVASMDKHLVRYAQRICVQKGKQEMISGMHKCTSDLLKEYQCRNGCLPRTIVFYRDGVSEGQFDQVLESEYRAMKRAFRQFCDGEYNPTVTFVTVQKRHHYRPQADENMSADDGSGKGNLAPGIVVDSTGLHPYEFQFLLNSHKTIQGTNHPALYQVLVDEAHFGAEQLILLTYYLTYTYQRCSRSVSIPAPAYYSHHVCTRGRLLEQQFCDGDMFDPAVQHCMSWI